MRHNSGQPIYRVIFITVLSTAEWVATKVNKQQWYRLLYREQSNDTRYSLHWRKVMKEAHLLEQDTYEKVILKCKFKKEHARAWGGGRGRGRDDAANPDGRVQGQQNK